MKIFVTGGTGFIGRSFINEALSNGHQVVAIYRNVDSNFLKEHRNIEWMKRELKDVDETDLIGCSALVHLASAGISPRPDTLDECFRVNVLDSLNLIKVAINAKVENFVVTGTYAEYGVEALKYDEIPTDIPLKPNSIYASSKAAFFVGISALCRKYKFSLSYQRLFSVYGEGQYHENLWPQLIYHARNNIDFKMTFGEQIRDFIHVNEVAKELLHEVMNHNEPGEPKVSNLASGKPVSIKEFAEYWWNKIGSKAKLQLGAIPYRDGEVMRYVPKIEKRKE